MCKTRHPVARPNWLDPAATAPSAKGTSAGHNKGPSNGSSKGQVAKNAPTGVQVFFVSPEWTLVKVGGNFYAEYHSSHCPEQLYSRNDGTPLLILF